MSAEYVRIFASARVDHLSKPGPLAPLCGQALRVGQWRRDLFDPYPGTHICYRCAAIAADGAS